MTLLTISAGDKPTAAQFNSFITHTGAAWDAWTPAVVQSGAVTVTVNQGSYWRAGRLVVATCALTVTSTGTASNLVTVSLPVTARGSTATVFAGTGYIIDASGPNYWSGIACLASTTTCQITTHTTGGAAQFFLGTSGFTSALASGDQIILQLAYEAAAG